MQQLNRRLREEQDAEYQCSLLADQEREKQRVAERAAHEEQQRAAQQAQDAERQESYLNCSVNRCLQCLHRSACACSTKSERACCCDTQACLCAGANFGVDRASSGYLNSLCSTTLKLLSSATWLLWHMPVSYRQACNVIFEMQHFVLSYVAPKSDIDAIQLGCIKSMVCQQLLLLWRPDKRHMISPVSLF